MQGLLGVQGWVEGGRVRLRGSGTSLNAYGQLSKKGPSGDLGSPKRRPDPKKGTL